jgi:hypothetical protein
MRAARMIPITSIMRHYWALVGRPREHGKPRPKGMPQQKRLDDARHLVKHPEELAREFAESVAHFAKYENIRDPFYLGRPIREFGKALTRTSDVTSRLRNQRYLMPMDAVDRKSKPPRGGVFAVPAKQLAFDYCDCELLVQRTSSPAEWEDGKRNLGGIRIDVLLANTDDHTPIVAEVKLPGDKDPYSALIQALAGAAHLATANQYARMRKHLCVGKFPELRNAPQIDVYVLLVKPPGFQAGDSLPGRYMSALTNAADTLAPHLLAQDTTKNSLRRIAALDIRLDTADRIEAKVRWAWQRSP